MAKEVVMPRLSDTMEEGKILKWLKRPGQEIRKGEPLVEIETDKANMELEAYDNGVLTQIVIDDGGQAPIGETIAYIGSPDEVQQGGAAPSAQPSAPEGQTAPDQPSPAPPGQPAAPETTAGPAGETAPAPQPGALPDPAEQMKHGTGVPASEHEVAIAGAQDGRETSAAPGEGGSRPAPVVDGQDDGRVKASPLARKIAQERGIDLRTVRGSGPGGRILRDDVAGIEVKPDVKIAIPGREDPAPLVEPVVEEAAIDSLKRPEPTVPAGQPQPLTRMQQTIARRMTASKQQVPHFYVTTEVDTGDLTELRKQLNGAGEDVKISYNDLIVKAVALALADMPLLNSSWRDDAIHQNGEINIGIAVAVERGLVVPVVHSADAKGVRLIARENHAMFERVRENKPRPDDFQGATFTISNLGMYDVDDFIAIIDQPAAAILAIGSIGKKAVVVDDEIVVRERMRITISADHRVVYGAEAAQFLQIVKRRLESPYSLLG